MGPDVPAVEGEARPQGVAPQGGGFFHQRDREALIGDGQGRGHAGRPAAEHEGRLGHRQGDRPQGLDQVGLGHGHAHQVLALDRRLFVLVHVHPGALVADVGHLEEIRVQPRLPDGLLEQRLVGPGRTGGHDHAVQVVLQDLLLDDLLGVRGAGVHVVHGVDHPRKPPGVLGHGGDVHHPADVQAAVADEHPDAGRLSGDVPLRGQLARGDLGAPHRGQGNHGPGSSAGTLHHRLGDVLGLSEGTADVHSLPGSSHRVEGAGAGEAVVVELDAEGVGQLAGLDRRLQPRGEHHHLELPGAVLLGVLVHVADHEVAVLSGLADLRGAAAGEADAQPLGPLVVLVEALAVGPDVHVEDLAGQVRLVLHGDDGFLDGVHAAHRRAVVVLRIPAAHALDEGQPTRLPPVRRTQDLAGAGTAGRQDPLELQARDHVREGAVAELRLLRGVVEAETRGQDHGAGLDRGLPVFLGVLDGLDRADLLADAAVPGLEVYAVVPIDDRHIGQRLGEGDVHRRAGFEAHLEARQEPGRRAGVDGLEADRAGGAHALAGPAGQTDLAAPVVGGVHPHGRAPAHEVRHGGAHPLAADAHAQAAEDAVVFLLGEARLLEAVVAGQVLEDLAFRAAGQQELDRELAALSHALACGAHLQAFPDLVVAGGHHPGALAHDRLDDAQPAAAVGLEGGVIAEGRDRDAAALADGENGFSPLGRDLPPVEGYGEGAFAVARMLTHRIPLYTLSGPQPTATGTRALRIASKRQAL